MDDPHVLLGRIIDAATDLTHSALRGIDQRESAGNGGEVSTTTASNEAPARERCQSDSHQTPLTWEQIERWREQGKRVFMNEDLVDALCDAALRGIDQRESAATESPSVLGVEASNASRQSDDHPKVMQRTNNDCMRACLATYFSIPIEQTPALEDHDWIAQLRAWLRPHGFGFVCIAVPNEDVFKEAFSDGFLIVSGKSARGLDHAVIYRDGILWHDPHPSSSGIKSVEYVDFFYPLNLTGQRSSASALRKLEDQVYVPGLWRCAKCNLRLIHTNLHVATGTTSANNEPQQCVNGCGPMWRVSERDERQEAQRSFVAECEKRESAEQTIIALREDAERWRAECERDYNDTNWTRGIMNSWDAASKAAHKARYMAHRNRIADATIDQARKEGGT